MKLWLQARRWFQHRWGLKGLMCIMAEILCLRTTPRRFPKVWLDCYAMNHCAGATRNRRRHWLFNMIGRQSAKSSSLYFDRWLAASRECIGSMFLPLRSNADTQSGSRIAGVAGKLGGQATARARTPGRCLFLADTFLRGLLRAP